MPWRVGVELTTLQALSLARRATVQTLFAAIDRRRTVDGQEKPLILVAEDDDSQRELLAEVLQLEGYQVVTASSAIQLVTLLGECPALILMDVVGIAGPQVFRAVALLDRRPKLVLMSGDLRVERVALQLGADAFVAKPYDLSTLIGTLERVLRQRSVTFEPRWAVT